ncbi:hypothetical protein SanaruYs_30940 [Chryseotalea sanaruensis]|uniref:STAS/SEC14 domain-containing protein n=1 Tax=Chryseotalea sanaruensis TaxID=2482724 RepID=A0A401UD77_9BACT|nr:hypothetical protein [Chryseotalea sanaruensis]GCC52855.1 hypothetical protein SanaruYs_30940 [Chryseotalea sanaruensis]
MERIRVINIQGHSIIVVDYAGCKEDEMLALAALAKEAVKADGTLKLVISRYSNMYITPRFVRFFENETNEVKPFLKKNALIGLNEPKKIIVKAFNFFMGTDFRAFDSEKEALEFLVDAPIEEEAKSIFD